MQAQCRPDGDEAAFDREFRARVLDRCGAALSGCECPSQVPVAAVRVTCALCSCSRAQPSDIKYAITSSASDCVMRNGGIGPSGGIPFAATPVVKRRNACSFE